jgi:curved DNA-binding protein CbpA
MNFYEALDLTPSATTTEIEEAYRKAARKVHPDLNPHDRLSAETRMKLLNRIRDTLADPKHRAAYDAELAEGQEAARIENAINETLKESRDKAIRRHQLKRTTLAGLVLGASIGVGTWLWSHWRTPQPELPFPSAIPEAVSTPARRVNSPKSVPLPSSPVSPRRGKGPDVIQLGSSTQEVLDFMGKPDQVEEIPSQNLRVLHYGQLRLVFRNDRLIPGSGVEAQNPARRSP